MSKRKKITFSSSEDEEDSAPKRRAGTVAVPISLWNRIMAYLKQEGKDNMATANSQIGITKIHQEQLDLTSSKRTSDDSRCPTGTWPEKKNYQRKRDWVHMDSTSLKEDGPGPIKKAKVSSLIEKELHDENITKTPKAEQPRKSLLPLTVDKFTFHHSLGQGYFGKVMFATDCVRGEQVAIKSVEKRALLHMSNGLVERKVLELARENIFLVHGYGAFHTQNYIYYVMELVGGGTLHEYLTKVPSPTLGIVKFIGAELVCGLQFIHSKGVIHRDLKTENILLTSRGHIKIADFGLALDNVFGKTPGRDIMSTPGLAAPEMILGQPYGCGVDWFAFGAIMHLMLTGKTPFCGKSRAQVERNVLERPIKSIWFGPFTGDFLARLLCKDQSQRLGEHGDIRNHPFFFSINWEKLEAGKVESPVIANQGSLESYTMQRIQVPYAEIWKEPIPEMFQQVFNSVPFVCSAWAENYHNTPMHPDAVPKFDLEEICDILDLGLLSATTSVLDESGHNNSDT